MKGIKLLLGSIIILMTACEEADHLAKFNEKHQPNDHFYFQRAFPDSMVDYRAMEESLKKAEKASRLNVAKSSDTEWQQEGPLNIGGRINCIGVHPENPDILLSGTAGGGVFRTNDGGENWEELTSELSHLPIGDVVFDPVNPDIIYIGTGDVNISGTVYIGNGLYRSTDGGDTWENIGLEDTRVISKIIINPENTQEIYIGAMGVPFQRDFNRGIYKTMDGGENWDLIFNVSDESGVIDLVMNPEDPNVLYASNWNRIRTSFESVASGDESEIYKSVDAGETWTEMTNGLPEGPMSRIGLKLWEGDSDVLFAIYVGTDFRLHGVYKSDDAGESFTEVNTEGVPEDVLRTFGWYFGKIGVNPWDVNEISVLGVDMFTTFDGGENWEMSVPIWWQNEVHADKHDIEYVGPDEVLLATDGGLYRSTDGLQTWTDIDRIPNTQFYRIAHNPHEAGTYYGGAQDNGTSIKDVFSPNEDWLRTWGGDGFTPIPDPENPLLVYVTTQNGNFWALDYEFGDTYSLTTGIDEEDRTNWDSPLIMDHFDNSILYTGTERVYKFEGAPFGSWEPISPSLVDESDEFASRRNISSLNQSELNEEVLYAGTTDGKVWVSTDGGDDWNEVSQGLPGYYVTDVKASQFEEATVFVSVSGYRDYDETPHLYRSVNYGEDWEDVTGDLVEMPINHVELYEESTWFIATDNGVYHTTNSGENWERTGSGMPFVVVLDLEVDPILNRLVAGTFAQSMFSVDLEELLDGTVSVAETDREDLKLFPNPSSDFIRLEGVPEGQFSWTIFDLSGKAVNQGNRNSSGGILTLNIQDLPIGPYILNLNSGSDIRTAKFMVSR